MSRKEHDSFSSPSDSHLDPDEIRTLSASSRASPPTPLSEIQPRTARSSFTTEPPLITPNDRRGSSAGGFHDDEPDFTAHNQDSMHMNAQVKFYHQKLQDQDQVHRNKVHNLEQEIARLKARAIDPSYVEDLETHNQDLWNSNQDLSNQIEEIKLDNKKLKDTNTWQQKEIDHILQECKQNGAAIRSVAGVQRGQFNTKNTQLREQLDTAREENASLYEKCTALEQEIDKLKLQYGVATVFSDRLKLVNISKDEMLREEELATLRKGFSRLHDGLDRSIESRIVQEGTMLFETEEIKAKLDAEQRTVEELKAQIRTQQDHIGRQEDQIEELRAEKEFSGSPNLTSELENAETLASTASSMGEITPYRNNVQRELKHVKEQLEEEKTKNRRLIAHITVVKQSVIETGLDKTPLPRDSQLMFSEIENIDQDMDLVMLGDTILPSIEEDQSQNALSNSQLPSEENDGETVSTGPETWVEMLNSLWKNLNEGLDNDDYDLMWWSSSSSTSSKTAKPDGSQDKISQSGVYIGPLSVTRPPMSSRLWTEMICAGTVCWAKIEIKDHVLWAKVKGPLWWSLIIQLLMFMLVPSLAIAWWCIMTASAERELWLAANEITFKKYWDTSVWGAERDLLWRLCYGLGLV